MVEETGEPGENYRLTPSRWQSNLTCPGRDSIPGSGENQLAVSVNALDHGAIGALH